MTRNVVISGGGTGIGLAVARLFAAGGDRVLLVGRRREVLERAGVPGAVVCAGDISGVEGVRGVVRVVDEEFGGVDVLVHGAGGNGGLEPSSGSSDPLEVVSHEWGVNFRSNTLSAVLLTEALKERISSPGRVLFVSSIAAFRGSGSGAYAASKAALHPYAHDLARQLGPRGITVNVVAPGYVEDTEFFGGPVAEERRERLIGETSNGRAGTPGDVAETLHWLASAGAGHVTSQVVQVNGGAERGH
ncbi:SDR family NAD(P)-dependent oxidoreductase [Streptomyces sp. 4F14]|uniref:SDR family NAD(P)-dependent oxidoreductase n=1 Tax=Streptomyces sp. 4F14 TaxID=3394380 RepID=UPI003A89386B